MITACGGPDPPGGAGREDRRPAVALAHKGGRAARRGVGVVAAELGQGGGVPPVRQVPGAQLPAPVPAAGEGAALLRDQDHVRAPDGDGRHRHVGEPLQEGTRVHRGPALRVPRLPVLLLSLQAAPSRQGAPDLGVCLPGLRRRPFNILT